MKFEVFIEKMCELDYPRCAHCGKPLKRENHINTSTPKMLFNNQFEYGMKFLCECGGLSMVKLKEVFQTEVTGINFIIPTSEQEVLI